MSDTTGSDDEDDILNTPPTPPVEDTQPPGDGTASETPTDSPVSEDDPDLIDDDPIDTLQEDDDTAPRSSNEIEYDETIIEMRGTPADELTKLLEKAGQVLGYKALDAEVRTPGSWANILFRMRMDPNYEEIREQTALSRFTDDERALLSATEVDKKTGRTVFKSSMLRDENNKIILRTSRMGMKLNPGEKKHLSGQDALLAFEVGDKGGGYRIPLYNSGLTIDILAPTGNDLQTLLYNCSMHDRELGSSLGAHYFTYSDVMYKTQVLNFLQPLIIGSSYADWKKKEKLYAAIKFPDYAHIIAALAAICHPNGFDNFVVTCKRPPDEKDNKLCSHVETFTADILKMIITRWSAMSKESIDHMVEARSGSVKHTATQIAKYQAGLGFEGEKVSYGDITFTMKIPTLVEYLEAGTQFLADIINEIEGDNTQGREEQVGIRYIRTFLPWIASIEKDAGDGASAITSDLRAITRVLDMVNISDEKLTLRDQMEQFIGKCQLTYVGHPILPCSACGYVADTPSGMWTFDPFSTFFTLALLYLKPSDSTRTESLSTNT